jgi:hypothetical protein
LRSLAFAREFFKTFQRGEALDAVPRWFPIPSFRKTLKSFLKENFENKPFLEPIKANSFEVRKDSIEAGYL